MDDDEFVYWETPVRNEVTRGRRPGAQKSARRTRRPRQRDGRGLNERGLYPYHIRLCVETFDSSEQYERGEHYARPFTSSEVVRERTTVRRVRGSAARRVGSSEP